ncbi:FecR domain-containing protein [Sphingomonas sp.]|uniref:FecR family protein n=1 Tax=Sphingomonas sp. TaxID=28214 RepID=UPI0025FF2672|nr:FecR domain-containing protein [Sphingomonas sp.]
MTDRHIDDEALDWAIRMAEPDADWDAFLAWLEGDAARSDRYDRAVAMLDDAAGAAAAVVTAPVSAPLEPVARPTRRRWIGGAIAAALAGAIGLGVWTQLPQPYAVATAPGEQRTVALGDGSSIVLAGASTVTLDHRDPRVATVERGEMLFRVRHDADRPFAVRAGALRLIDLGTVFDVKTDGARTRVAVSEGAVMVDPDGAALRLDPGQAVVAEGETLARHDVAAADVGGWREGRLAYDDAPLSEVAADLSRQTGRRIVAGPGIAARTFRGTLDVATIRERPALLGTLLGVAVRQDAEGWTLEPRR